MTKDNTISLYAKLTDDKYMIIHIDGYNATVKHHNAMFELSSTNLTYDLEETKSIIDDIKTTHNLKWAKHLRDQLMDRTVQLLREEANNV